MKRQRAFERNIASGQKSLRNRERMDAFASIALTKKIGPALMRAARICLIWCSDHGVRDLTAITPIHVAGWIEELGRSLSPPRSTAPGCDPASVRLAGRGPDPAVQPGLQRARPGLVDAQRPNPGAGGGGGEGDPRCDRCEEPARRACATGR